MFWNVGFFASANSYKDINRKHEMFWNLVKWVRLYNQF